MRNSIRQPGFTLMETLLAAAIIMTLVGVLTVTGKKMRRRAETELTQSTMAVLDTALEVYYEAQGDYVPMVSTQALFEDAVFGLNSDPTVTIESGLFPDDTDEGQRNWRNAAMTYFLNREPQSRSILNSLMSGTITNKDAAGANLLIQIPTGAAPISWIRVLDAWGTPLDYVYNAPYQATATYTLPLIRSAGPDKDPDTEADNITNR